MQNKITKRPTSFSSFIGQNKIKKTIKMMIDAKSKQNLAIDHILLVAQQGCGKTTMATIIANQTSLPIRYSQGLDINTKADIMVLLNGLQENEIIFIDEIHSINRNVLEFFYQIMENGDIDIKLGVGDDQKIVKLKIPNFTLVGATNQINKLPLPFRDRFGLICYFEKYKLEDIEKIISKFIISEKLEIEKTALSLISSSVSLNPRLAI
ncbi:MAG: AAA family ATPase, partial [Mycoplasma sp.]|nr:AAA family ATPase [Mycoplasma sp.]